MHNALYSKLMTNEKLLQIIEQTLEQHGLLEVDRLNATDHLRDDLGLDSIGFLTLAQELEESLGLELNETLEGIELNTVQDLIQLINKRTAEKEK